MLARAVNFNRVSTGPRQRHGEYLGWPVLIVDALASHFLGECLSRQLIHPGSDSVLFLQRVKP